MKIRIRIDEDGRDAGGLTVEVEEGRGYEVLVSDLEHTVLDSVIVAGSCSRCGTDLPLVDGAWVATDVPGQFCSARCRAEARKEAGHVG